MVDRIPQSMTAAEQLLFAEEIFMILFRRVARSDQRWHTDSVCRTMLTHLCIAAFRVIFITSCFSTAYNFETSFGKYYSLSVGHILRYRPFGARQHWIYCGCEWHRKQTFTNALPLVRYVFHHSLNLTKIAAVDERGSRGRKTLQIN